MGRAPSHSASWLRPLTERLPEQLVSGAPWFRENPGLHRGRIFGLCGCVKSAVESDLVIRYRGVVFNLVILCCLAVGAYIWATALQQSWLAYRSPLLEVSVPLGEHLPAQTRRVVLVVVSGISYQGFRASEMPTWKALQDSAAFAMVQTRSPSNWPAAWTTLLTGAWPELNGAALLTENDRQESVPAGLDHIIAAARDAGLHVAVAGSVAWSQILPADQGVTTLYAVGGDAIADGQIAQAALEFIADAQYQLILVQFDQLRTVGQTHGTTSLAYAAAARQIDSHVRQITRQMDLAREVLIVTSDMALLPNRRPAGTDISPPALAFTMAGENVVAGAFDPIQQIDLAPSIALLLGTRLPACSYGRPLFDMLRLDVEEMVVAHLRLAAQRVALGDAYLRAIGREGLGTTVHQDMEAARRAFDRGNKAGALQMAQLVTEESQTETSAAIAARVAAERWPRLAVMLAGIGLPIIMFWVRRLKRALLLIGAASLAVTSWYALYWLTGNDLSLTWQHMPWSLIGQLLWQVGAGLAVGGSLVTISLLYRETGRRRWRLAVVVGYDYGLVVAYICALPVLVIYWLQGGFLDWYVPALRLAIWQGVALTQIFVAAGLSASLPWLMGLVVWAVDRWQTRGRPPAVPRRGRLANLWH